MAVIRASELWSAMEPELLLTARAELEPSSEGEQEKRGEEEEGVQAEEGGQVEEERDDRATAVQIAQFLRVNKYR